MSNAKTIRAAVMMAVLAACLLGSMREARADWWYSLYCRAKTGMSMSQAGCGSNMCEHHDCKEGICYTTWATGQSSWSGKTGPDNDCGAGGYGTSYCGYAPFGSWKSCRQWPYAYVQKSYTRSTGRYGVNGQGAQGFAIGTGLAIGRCNGPDTAPDNTAGMSQGNCWTTCAEGSCWGTGKDFNADVWTDVYTY